MTRVDLMAKVWGDATVEEQNLNVAISAIRKALDPKNPDRYIETIPGVGYRFVGEVREIAEALPGDGLIGMPAAPPSNSAWVMIFCVYPLYFHRLAGVGFMAFPSCTIQTALHEGSSARASRQ